MKRFIFLCLTTLICFVPTCFAGTLIDGIYYNFSTSQNNLQVTYFAYNSEDNGQAYKGDIVIPEKVMYNGTEYTVKSIGEYAFAFCYDLTSVTLPETINEVNRYAFYHCENLLSINIPAGVKYLSQGAFWGCSSLPSIELPEGEGTLTIYSHVFRECTNLKTVKMGDNVDEINTYTFADCPNLVSINLSKKLTKIHNSLFLNCTSLPSIELPEGIVSIVSYAFRDCTSLKSVTIGDNVEDIGSYTFRGCSSLESITIPDKMTDVESSMCQNCTNLTTVKLGASVKEIHSAAFQNCTSLKEVYSYNPEPPTVGGLGFSDVDLKRATLYVPVGAREAYRVADTWGDFSRIKEMTEFAIETLEATDVTDTSATLNGTVTAAYDNPIIEKGFEYWTGDNEVQTVVAAEDDDEMIVTVTDLESDTKYSYRAYAKTENGEEYGEELSFTTEVPEGISSIHVDSENIEGIYSTSGQKLDSTVDGVNIVHYTDGTTKKILVK